MGVFSAIGKSDIKDNKKKINYLEEKFTLSRGGRIYECLWISLSKMNRVNYTARDQPPELDVSVCWSMIDVISMLAA